MTEFLCGCGSWLCPPAWKTRSMHLLHLCYRIMLNIEQLHCLSNERIYHLTNTQPLINTVRQHQLHGILRMHEEEPWRYALYVSTAGWRRPGQQRTSYLSYLQKLIGDAENDLTQDAIASLAADWCAWRKFVHVVTCSTVEWWMNEWMNEWMNALLRWLLYPMS